MFIYALKQAVITVTAVNPTNNRLFKWSDVQGALQMYKEKTLLEKGLKIWRQFEGLSKHQNVNANPSFVQTQYKSYTNPNQ